jgi:hypothetical protein
MTMIDRIVTCWRDWPRPGRWPQPGRWVRDDRGDVPGWVMVTLMTAGLVTAIWLVAEPRLTELFNSAIDGVLGGP